MMITDIPKEVDSIFDTNWYLSKYPDVAAFGGGPKAHFWSYGWAEFRWPCHFKAVELDEQLWAADNPAKLIKALEGLSQSKKGIEAGLSLWFLTRWYASFNDWIKAKKYIKHMLDNKLALKLIRHEGPFLVAFSCFYELQDAKGAKSVIESHDWSITHNKRLAHSMLAPGDSTIDIINEIFVQENLALLSKEHEPSLNELFSTCDFPLNDFWFKPLVSIIIPCFNAEGTISVALKSLQAQSYKNFEVIAVDDASTDDSKGEFFRTVGNDPRFKFISLEENGGTYNARNIGLRHSRGRFITTHDADDWSHPQKIEFQVAALKVNKQAKASISHWVRCDEKLKFGRWRMEDGWIYRNISSLMFKREVYKKLGYWDNVAVNADSEFLERVILKFGSRSIVDVLPSVPLAFGRATETSLTQTSHTHLRTQFNGLRKDYMSEARAWHKKSSKLFMPFNKERMFFCPPYICRGSEASRTKNLVHYLQNNGLFDNQYYLEKNQDVKCAGADPFRHFIEFGLKEGRDPNAFLSVSGYAYSKTQSYLLALSDWTAKSCTDQLPVTADGQRSVDSKKVNILMVAHQLGEHLFGAERSFLDCVKMLETQNFNIFLILPEAKNIPYIDELATHAIKIFFVPLCWWNGKRKKIESTIQIIGELIEKYNIDYLYGNTITLWEPFLAAKEKNITSVMHIREIPENDNDLCELLSAKPTEVKRHVASLATRYIANSEATYNAYEYACKCKIVPNIVNIPDRSNKQIDRVDIEVVMVSSNIEKKGIRDFFKVAESCYEKSTAIKFTIYGPNTKLLQELLDAYSHKNLHYGGFLEALSDVYEKAHIVLSLSHFAESFGRTVIEGMAHRCVVIAYFHKALSELIDKNSGVLVETYSVEQVVKEILTLKDNRDRLKKLGNNAALRVANAYRVENVAPRLVAAILNE